MKRRSKVVLWILGVVISILLVTIGGIYSYGNHLFNKIEKIEIDKSDVGISDKVEEKLSQYSDNVKNIALFGIDAEDGGVGR